MIHDSWRDHVVLKRHPRSKHVRLKIHPTGRVEVVVPTRFDEGQLPRILAQHQAWVEKQLQRLDLQANRPLSLPEELRLDALEELWQLEYKVAPGGRCKEYPGTVLQVTGESREQQRQALKRWLSRRARRELIPWLQQTSDELGLPFRQVTMRCQRTRWGSCSARGDINLNYGLLFVQPDLVRYLFVHELCHTIHLNHSSRYWALVERHEPHYRQMERGLKQATKCLPAWLYHPFSD